MTSKSPVRSCEDVDEAALSYAEIKALCAGDPRIKERMELDTDVARLKIMRADHCTQQYRLEDNALVRFPAQIAETEKTIEAIEADMETLLKHPHPVDGFAGMNINGATYDERAEAGLALLDACADIADNNYTEIGSYRGFVLFTAFTGVQHILVLKSAGSYRVELGWAEDYFNSLDVQEDKRDEEKFVPKPYTGSSGKTSATKADKKKSEKKPETKKAQDAGSSAAYQQLTLGV